MKTKNRFRGGQGDKPSDGGDPLNGRAVGQARFATAPLHRKDAIVEVRTHAGQQEQLTIHEADEQREGSNGHPDRDGHRRRLVEQQMSVVALLPDEHGDPVGRAGRELVEQHHGLDRLSGACTRQQDNGLVEWPPPAGPGLPSAVHVFVVGRALPDDAALRVIAAFTSTPLASTWTPTTG